MFKLYGFAVSNYYNMVKLALLEKGIPFEEVPFFPAQTPHALAISPCGKVPVLEVEPGKFLSETSVILEFLEQTQDGEPLLPHEAYPKAKARELMKEIELYVELPARTCYGEAFFGTPVEPLVKEKARADLLKGMATLKRNGEFAPFVAGSEMTLADVVFCFTLDLASAASQKVLGLDLMAEFPQAKALLEQLHQLPNVQRIQADKEAAMPKFLEMMRAKG